MRAGEKGRTAAVINYMLCYEPPFILNAKFFYDQGNTVHHILKEFRQSIL